EIVACRTAAVKQDVMRAELAQSFELGCNLVRRSVQRALLASFARIGECQYAGLVQSVRPLRNRGESSLRRKPALERRFLIGLIFRYVERAGDADLHRIEPPTPCFHAGLEPRDALANRLDRGELVEQQIVAAFCDFTDRVRTAGAHPQRRMRLLRGWRLDDDIL